MKDMRCMITYTCRDLEINVSGRNIDAAYASRVSELKWFRERYIQGVSRRKYPLKPRKFTIRVNY